MKTVRYVSKNESGHFPNDYKTIAQAVKSVPVNNTEPVTIFIRNGCYHEKLIIDRPMITLEGEDVNQTIITYDDYALMMLEDGMKRGTFRTPTLFINTHDFTARNITIQNNAGYGTIVGSALALYVDGDRITFDHCRILGHKNTIFTAPLPPLSKEFGEFTGPKEFAPRTSGRHYYRDCYIEGEVDMIFGGATAFFENCELYTVHPSNANTISNLEATNTFGYITYASTPRDQEYGYIFSHCRLTSNCPKHSVYLGHPWRNYAKTVFISCEFGEHIRLEGFCDDRSSQGPTFVFYREYENYGPGASIKTQDAISKQLTPEELPHYEREQVLFGHDGWTP